MKHTLIAQKRIISEHNSSNYSNVEGQALAIKNAINTLCSLKSSIGLARTKSLAKIASNMRKPDGLTILYPNELQHFLKNLEVNRISGVAESMGIGQLANCDVQLLMDRFGKKNGLWLWQVANRRDVDPVIKRGSYFT
jgi:DNA polymerase IV (DinB-like DNA polymerase)